MQRSLVGSEMCIRDRTYFKIMTRLLLAGVISLAADLVMIAHFLLAAFMTAGFVAIPIGYKFRWSWAQNRRLRICHASVMGVITAETIVGLTCPLTVLEHSLRGDSPPQSFVGYWIQRILYWDLPHEIFIAVYFLCFTWVIFLWKWCPPRERLTRTGSDAGAKFI